MAWRAAMSWMGMSSSRWCMARSSTALIAYSALAETRMERSGLAAVLEHARGVLGEIGDDDVRPGPADRGQRLHHRPLLVEPAELAGRLDHRVLPRHRVRGQRQPEIGL